MSSHVRIFAFSLLPLLNAVSFLYSSCGVAQAVIWLLAPHACPASPTIMRSWVLAGPLKLSRCFNVQVSFPLFSLPAWAAGAIAFELFGGVNPFGWDRLDSRTYHDEHLPLLAM